MCVFTCKCAVDAKFAVMNVCSVSHMWLKPALISIKHVCSYSNSGKTGKNGKKSLIDLKSMIISAYNATDLCRPKAPGKKWQLTQINYIIANSSHIGPYGTPVLKIRKKHF